jgi:hypothetical protein
MLVLLDIEALMHVVTLLKWLHNLISCVAPGYMFVTY